MPLIVAVEKPKLEPVFIPTSPIITDDPTLFT
jgi:hypothetical protein